MKMKYEKIMDRYKVLLAVGKLALPRPVSTAIARNMVNLEKEVSFILQQKRDIANRFAKKDEKEQFVLDETQQNYVFDSEEDKNNFLRELQELEACEVEVDIMKFNINDLQSCDTTDRYDILTPIQEASLNWMIDYE